MQFQDDICYNMTNYTELLREEIFMDTNILLENGTNELEVLEFTLNDNHYGINVAKIREILAYQPVTPIPNAQPSVEGIFMPRDAMITVINLKRCLSLPVEGEQKGLFIITNFNKLDLAFHVDEVIGIHRVSWADIIEPDSTINAGENGREIPRSPVLLPPVDLLIVMLGSNDLLQKASAATVTARMAAFIHLLPLAKNRIFLIAPPPMQPGGWVTEESLLTESRQLAQRYQMLAQRLGIHFSDAGDWNISLSYDGVHFTEEGHKSFAAGLYQALSRINFE